MANRPILANSCARAATAAEARFRIDAKPIRRPRATSVVALDDGAMELVRELAGQEWNAARFLGLPDGSPAGEYAGPPAADRRRRVRPAGRGAGRGRRRR